MKLRNKKTGAIYSIEDIDLGNNKDGIWLGLTLYNSLAELNEEWEDYEEPKEWWYIDIHGPHKVTNNDEYYQQVKAASKEIGNYFETKEEAEKAVEKLKAWKRLKDKGFKAFSSEICGDNFVVSFKLTNHVDYSQSIDDFDCIFDFGGEE